MKKYFNLFLSLFIVVLVSCNQYNPNDPDNPSNPSGNKKVKYIVESANWFTFQDVSNGSHWSTSLNVVSKTVHERGSEAKYLRSRSTYEGDELKTKFAVQNESDRDYMWIIYPTTDESLGKDTIIWYDEARTKQKEVRNSTTVSIYVYDAQHHDRQISTKNYNRSGSLWAETNYSYSDLTQYGETKFYDGNGNLYSIHRSIAEFMDDTFTKLKSYESKAYTYPSNQLNSISKTTYEWDDELWVKSETVNESYDQDGNIIFTSKSITTNSWTDELSNTSTTDCYINGVLNYTQKGYSKYTY